MILCLSDWHPKKTFTLTHCFWPFSFVDESLCLSDTESPSLLIWLSASQWKQNFLTYIIYLKNTFLLTSERKGHIWEWNSFLTTKKNIADSGHLIALSSRGRWGWLSLFYSSVNCSSSKHLSIVIPTLDWGLRGLKSVSLSFSSYCNKEIINSQRHSWHIWTTNPITGMVVTHIWVIVTMLISWENLKKKAELNLKVQSHWQVDRCITWCILHL